MLSRLSGLETEYAIRFSSKGKTPNVPGGLVTPDPGDGDRPQRGRVGGDARPSHELVYRAITAALGRLIATRPGSRRQARQQIFVENGGAFYYELLPYAPDDGLIEGSTPECRGPGELLLYQRAQEQLLAEALPMAEETLARQGSAGELGLLKNCRDAQGHVYGAQENYEVEMASGVRLWLYRAGLVLLVPWVAVTALTLLLAVLGLVAATLVFYTACLVALLIPALRTKVHRVFDGDARDGPVPRVLGRVGYALEFAIATPLFAAFASLLALLCFRRQRRALLPFLASRVIFTGAGSLLDRDHFVLSEKAPAMNRIDRVTANPHAHAVFDGGHLMKALLGPITLDFGSLVRLFRRRQRLQLGLSDSNMSEVAEYLKVGTTLLVLDLAEAGLLDDAPILRCPLEAIHTLAADPTLAANASICRGGAMRALELQRFYLDRAKAFVQSSDAVSMEARDVLKLWEQVLDRLAEEPASLVGTLDWPTKRWLMESVADGAPFEVAKKVDLRYHELQTGYFAELKRSGSTVDLLDPAMVEQARTKPPDGSPARLRSELIRRLSGSRADVAVSWHSVRVGGRVKGQVIRLDDYRDERGS